MKRNEVAQVLGILSAGHPRQHVPEDTIEVWSEMLTDLPEGRGVAAAKRCLKDSKFFPSIAEFTEQVRALGPHPAERPSKGRELTEGAPVTKDEAKRNIEALKGHLATIGRRKL